MTFLRALLPALAVLLMQACSLLKPPPGYTSVSYSIHFADGGQAAERSLEAAGTVAGSHLSGSRQQPRVGMSKEPARPADLAELARMTTAVRQRGIDGSAPPAGQAYRRLTVRYADGAERTFYRREGARPGAFEDADVARMAEILGSYQAGYW